MGIGNREEARGGADSCYSETPIDLLVLSQSHSRFFPLLFIGDLCVLQIAHDHEKIQYPTKADFFSSLSFFDFFFSAFFFCVLTVYIYVPTVYVGLSICFTVASRVRLLDG